jgi:hypothetical protein
LDARSIASGDWFFSCFLIAAGLRAGPARSQGGAPRGGTTLTPGGPARIIGRRGSRPGGDRVCSVHRRCSLSGFPSRRAGRPGLSRCAERLCRGSGDMMRDRVPRGGVRPLILWRPDQSQTGSGQQRVGRSWPRVHRSAGAPARVGQVGHAAGGQGLLSEFTQGVVAAAGQLAGYRQGGQPGGALVPDRGVVAVVRSGRACGALGRLVQRPAHFLCCVTASRFSFLCSC